MGHKFVASELPLRPDSWDGLPLPVSGSIGNVSPRAKFSPGRGPRVPSAGSAVRVRAVVPLNLQNVVSSLPSMYVSLARRKAPFPLPRLFFSNK